MAGRLCSFWLSTIAALVSTAEAKDLWIDAVTVVSPERAAPQRGVTVQIQNERIVKIVPRSQMEQREAAEVIDGTGLYLVPGLIDTHVHLWEVPGMRQDQEQAHPDIARAARDQFPRSYLYFGYTTLVDLNSWPDTMAAWNAHPVHPDTYFCGGAMVLDGYPMNFAPKPQRYEAPYFFIEPANKGNLPKGVDASAHTPEAIVARMKADGASCVKTFFERGFATDRNLPVPQLETVRKIVRLAHAADLPVFMHANSTEAQEFALQAGADIIAHGMWNWAESQATAEITPAVKNVLDGIVAAKRGWQATIQVLYGEQDLFNDSYLSNPMLPESVPADLIRWYGSKDGQWFHDVLAEGRGIKPGDRVQDIDGLPIARVKSAVAYLAQHEGRILFGTDTPSSPTYANPPGLNGRMEMHRLLDSGLTPAQIFKAATLANAEALGLSGDVGTVQAGKRANLLLLRGDPTQSIGAYDHIEKVILRGRVLDRAGLAADAATLAR